MDPVVIVTSTQKDQIPHFLKDGAIQFRKVHTNTFQNCYRLLQQYPRLKDDQSVGMSKKTCVMLATMTKTENEVQKARKSVKQLL